jgi:hypothetical protein
MAPCDNTCCGMQPCSITSIVGLPTTTITDWVLNDVLTIGTISYINKASVVTGGGCETLCCAPNDIALTVTLRNPESGITRIQAGCLHLCVTGMFGQVTIPETTLYGYNSTGVKVTTTLSGYATITFCNGIRKITLQSIVLS